MTRSWAKPFVGLLALTALFGVSAVYSTPDDGRAIGIWPVALATAPLLVTRRPRTSLVLLVVFVIAVLSIWSDRPLEVAVGFAVGITAQCCLVWWLLTGGVRRRPTLYTDVDLARFIGASVAGALLASGLAAATSVVTDWGSPGIVALSIGSASLASQLSVTPFFLKLRGHSGMAPVSERVIQWVLILTLTPAVFLVQDFPAVVFMVIPLLGWGALRNGAYEALAQLFAVIGIAIALTTRGHGPFAMLETRYGLGPDVQGIVLATFVIDCALIVVPLMLSVGEQLENARQVAAERDRVQNIVNGASGVAIIGTDENALVTLFNPGAERLLGYAAEEMVGKPTLVLHSEDAVAEKAEELGVDHDFASVARALIDTGPTDMRFTRKDGRERSHSMSLNRIEDDRGTLIGYVSTSEDITERLEAQQAALEALESERQAVERLREVDQVKDAFVSSVSHELRTPITSILGYTELLEDGAYGALTPEQLDAVHRVGTNSARLLSLIDDLLTLSRIQEEGIALVDRVVDLRKIVAAGCAVVAPVIERRNLDLTLDLPELPMPFLGDHDMLERVVINLVGNAVKFTPEGGQIAVALREASKVVVLEVSDTGIGIPEDEQAKLFTRFFRSSLAQEQAIQGSGLGLSIAHAIVEQHGGSISVRSAPGEGTTVSVSLPVSGPR